MLDNYIICSNIYIKNLLEILGGNKSRVLRGKMKKKELLTGEAKFHISRNDMFWECCLYTYEDGEFEWYHVKWSGYNDSFWWDNVSEKASIVTCIGDKGTEKKFKLNYNTLDVVEVE